ncbi:MAG: rRNA maturation RNase YbeY [Gloeomargaritaceae cyanobacterium C42_A2020_066]|nr:rRNA maturation RNase YbeY [Gloeomargaritaceae cyanobacterium C42_A2020_066]
MSLSPRIAVWIEEHPPTGRPLPTEATWQAWITTWLGLLATDLPPAVGYELGLRLTDDQAIQTLNRDFRYQDRSTDVLAFAALEAELPAPPDTDEPLYLGDVVISVPTAEHQAGRHGLTVELAWLASHGILHLLGWDHPDETRLEAMLTQQSQLLLAVGLTPPQAQAEEETA